MARRKSARAGPRGGRTTVTDDGLMIRKTFFIDTDVAELLRDDAHRQRRPEAEILRELLRRHYGVDDAGVDDGDAGDGDDG